jgi:hypothetical protein
MPSAAFSNYLQPLLADARELEQAHSRLRTGQRGRQWGLGALNRAVVVMSVSAWEAYVEELLKEAILLIRPPAPPLGPWPALNASALSQVGRFNNPNMANVRTLFSDYLGLHDVTAFWAWRNCPVARSRSYLEDALRFRHQIAHGVNPRPTVHNSYSSWLPSFFHHLGQCTDYGVGHHLSNNLGVVPPWP